MDSWESTGCAYTAKRKAFPVQEDKTLSGFEVEDVVD